MTSILHFVLSLVVIAALAILASSNRRGIRPRYVVQLLVIQIALAYLFLKSNIGESFVLGVAGVFTHLLGYAAEGTKFIFGGMIEGNLAFFFLQVLCPIIFISALIGILQHVKILPIVIRIIGTVLSKVNGMGKLESFNAVSSLLLGQSENFIAYKDQLNRMSDRRMYTMAANCHVNGIYVYRWGIHDHVRAAFCGRCIGSKYVWYFRRTITD